MKRLSELPASDVHTSSSTLLNFLIHTDYFIITAVIGGNSLKGHLWAKLNLRPVELWNWGEKNPDVDS